MNKIKLFFVVIMVLSTLTTVTAQTADEIISNYFENTGGEDAWKKIKGMKITAKMNQGGVEIPIETLRLKNGKEYTKYTFQGLELMDGVYDGETLWSTNFQSQKAEKSTSEATANKKLDTNDFPESLLDYKEKGYTLELMGKEDFNGSETFKLKLTKEPKTYEGKQVEDISFYYFDTENFVPVGVHSEILEGPAKGMISEITFSDYQEAGDIFFPYTITQGVKGQPGSPINFDSVEINPTVDESVFAFPEDQ